MGKIIGVAAFLLLTAGVSVYALALLLTRSELPTRFASLEPVRDIEVEYFFERLAQENNWDQAFSPLFLAPADHTTTGTGAVSAGSAPVFTSPVDNTVMTRITLTEKALNRQLIYLFREHPPRVRGLKQAYLAVEPNGLTLLGVIDGRALLRQMTPEQHHLLPTLLRREGVLRLRLAAHKDLIGRTWLHLESVSFGHLPVPTAVVNPLLESYLPESTFDMRDGFFVSRHLESLFFGRGFITVQFNS
ncbi:MAG: hypothetical protein JXQ27_05265 [Acidobacteria bacterium]|nr:hypothetical protein [Acidobacteriota bacterium]